MTNSEIPAAFAMCLALFVSSLAPRRRADRLERKMRCCSIFVIKTIYWNNNLSRDIGGQHYPIHTMDLQTWENNIYILEYILKLNRQKDE
jgi:hypothetical protein